MSFEIRVLGLIRDKKKKKKRRMMGVVNQRHSMIKSGPGKLIL